MKKGGVKYRSGKGTCVFKPAVKCQGEQQIRSGVSRIIKASDAGNNEIEAETIIRTKFPELVVIGAVTIHEHMCTPEFVPSDLEEDERYWDDEGCQKIDVKKPNELKNLITPERTFTLDDAIYGPDEVDNYKPPDKRELIKNALIAAVGLCPDDKRPWVIHGDCHEGNILAFKEGEVLKTTLIDWGSAIIVKSPDDVVESVRNYITGYLGIGVVGRQEDTYFPQHPDLVIDRLVDGVRDQNRELLLQTLRGWTALAILNQVKVGNYTLANLEPLLTCKNTSELIAKIKELVGIQIVVPPPPPKPSLPIKPATRADLPRSTGKTPPPAAPPKPKGGKTRRKHHQRRQTRRRHYFNK